MKYMGLNVHNKERKNSMVITFYFIMKKIIIKTRTFCYLYKGDGAVNAKRVRNVIIGMLVMMISAVAFAAVEKRT